MLRRSCEKGRNFKGEKAASNGVENWFFPLCAFRSGGHVPLERS